MKSALISMSRKDDEGPQALWDMLDKASKISKLPQSIELHLGVRDPFELSIDSDVGTNSKAQLPIILPLLLSDKQLECYLVHRFLLEKAIIDSKEISSAQDSRNTILTDSDRRATGHYGPDFLMGTLIKSSIVEWSWYNYTSASENISLMANDPDKFLSKFRKANYPVEKSAYASIINEPGQAGRGGSRAPNLSSRMENLGVELQACFDESVNEPQSLIFDPNIPGFKEVLASVFYTQAQLDIANRIAS